MRLIQPTPESHVQFLEALDAWGEGLHEDGFGLTEDDDVRSPEGFRAWIEHLRHDKTQHWWVTHDDDTNESSRILGAIALRPTPMNGSVLVGHIGYGVTPVGARHGGSPPPPSGSFSTVQQPPASLTACSCAWRTTSRRARPSNAAAANGTMSRKVMTGCGATSIGSPRRHGT